ncbi:Retrotransposon-derived protein PEG10 [Crotalus adamanteus]|uniref:Retrotransposon-derived protein PEG10 n=1 Tax=Crotalus adamanteus TaxID=8729 RepID=A0AAW1BCB3_CROAD
METQSDFLAEVFIYMQIYGRTLPTDVEKVCVVTLAMECGAADWMVTLYNCNTPELRNLNCFMAALCRHFEGQLVYKKAREQIKTVKQGRRPVSQYTKLFRELDNRLRWPQDFLVSCFHDELNEELYNACVACGAPGQLYDWCLLAEEVEID